MKWGNTNMGPVYPAAQVHNPFAGLQLPFIHRHFSVQF